MCSIGQDPFIRTCGSSEPSKPHRPASLLPHRHRDSQLSLNMSQAGTNVASCCMALTLNQMILVVSKRLLSWTPSSSSLKTSLRQCFSVVVRKGPAPFLLRLGDLNSVGCFVRVAEQGVHALAG
eukprot:6460634-Amphidinium_carterae.1